MAAKKRFERIDINEDNQSDLHVLQFNVAHLLKQSGSDSRSYDIDGAIVTTETASYRLSQPLQGRIKLIKTDRDILVMGSLTGELQLPCTRCLTDVTAPIELEIEDTFSPTVDISTGASLTPEPDADPATLISEQHILDLTEVVRQAIELNQPTQVFCRSECLGLCAQCGTDLNIETCDCNADTVDVRWAGLLNLKDKLQ